MCIYIYIYTCICRSVGTTHFVHVGRRVGIANNTTNNNTKYYDSNYISYVIRVCVYIYIYIYIYVTHFFEGPREEEEEELEKEEVEEALRESKLARLEEEDTILYYYTADLPTNIVDFRGFDSSTI